MEIAAPCPRCGKNLALVGIAHNCISYFDEAEKKLLRQGLRDAYVQIAEVGSRRATPKTPKKPKFKARRA